MFFSFSVNLNLSKLKNIHRFFNFKNIHKLSINFKIVFNILFNDFDHHFIVKTLEFLDFLLAVSFCFDSFIINR